MKSEPLAEAGITSEPEGRVQRRQCSDVHTQPCAQTPKRWVSSNRQSQVPAELGSAKACEFDIRKPSVGHGRTFSGSQKS